MGCIAGDILKYSLHGDADLVTLRKNFIISKAICVSRRTGWKSVSVRMKIEEDVMSCQVPKLILQPIVKNAIRHGIEQMKEGGQIRISAALESADLKMKKMRNFKSAENEKYLFIRGATTDRDDRRGTKTMQRTDFIIQTAVIKNMQEPF